MAKVYEQKQSYKEEFEKNGYVILKQMLSREEVDKLKAAAESYLSQVEKVNRAGVYLTLITENEAFRHAIQHPGLTPVLKDIIGDRVIFLNDKLVLKDAVTDFGSPWHQDHPYWFGSHKFSVWIALDEATKENGCLRVVPGSHNFGSVGHNEETASDKGFEYRLNEEDFDPSSIVDLPAGAGDAIVFHDLLYHASYSNTSGASRWAWILTYKDGRLEDPEYGWAKAHFQLP